MPQPATGGPTQYYTREITPDMPHKMFLIFTVGVICFCIGILFLCVASLDPILTKKTYTKEEWNLTQSGQMKKEAASPGFGPVLLPLLIVGFSLFGLSVCVMCCACVAYVAHFHYLDIRDDKRLPLVVKWLSKCCRDRAPRKEDDSDVPSESETSSNIEEGCSFGRKAKDEPRRDVFRAPQGTKTSGRNKTTKKRVKINSTLRTTLGHCPENDVLTADTASVQLHLKPQHHLLEDLKPQGCSSSCSVADRLLVRTEGGTDHSTSDVISREVTPAGSSTSSALPLAHSTPLRGNTPQVTPARRRAGKDATSAAPATPTPTTITTTTAVHEV